MRSRGFLCAILLLAGCHGAAPLFRTCQTLSPEAQALAGDRAAPAVEARYGGVARDAESEARMERIGRRLVQASDELAGEYHFRLLRTDRRNACSLPGGRVYVTRGLYERLESDDHVAAVLAHEMAHIATGDHFKGRCGNCTDALARESAADARGAAYLERAGIDPASMIEVLHRIRDVQPPGWSDTRIACLQRWIDARRQETLLAQHIR